MSRIWLTRVDFRFWCFRSILVHNRPAWLTDCFENRLIHYLEFVFDVENDLDKLKLQKSNVFIFQIHFQSSIIANKFYILFKKQSTQTGYQVWTNHNRVFFRKTKRLHQCRNWEIQCMAKFRILRIKKNASQVLDSTFQKIAN